MDRDSVDDTSCIRLEGTVMYLTCRKGFQIFSEGILCDLRWKSSAQRRDKFQ